MNEPIATTDPLQTWADGWEHTLDVMLHFHASLTAPPPAVAPEDPAARLRQLLRVRALLRLDADAPFPYRTAAEQLASRVHSSHHKADLTDLLAEHAGALDRELLGALDALPPGAFADVLVRTRDFTDRRVLSFGLTEPAPLGGQPADVWFVGGVVASLPEGHPHRACLPGDDCYRVDRTADDPGGACLVLGRAESYLGGGGKPKAFYLLADALRWTAHFRRKQREQDEEQARRDREEKRQELAKFWDSPLGKLRRAEAALRRLESQGQVPDLPEPAPPTVRQGR